MRWSSLIPTRDGTGRGFPDPVGAPPRSGENSPPPLGNGAGAGRKTLPAAGAGAGGGGEGRGIFPRPRPAPLPSLFPMKQKQEDSWATSGRIKVCSKLSNVSLVLCVNNMPLFKDILETYENTNILLWMSCYNIFNLLSALIYSRLC